MATMRKIVLTAVLMAQMTSSYGFALKCSSLGSDNILIDDPAAFNTPVFFSRPATCVEKAARRTDKEEVARWCQEADMRTFEATQLGPKVAAGDADRLYVYPHKGVRLFLVIQRTGIFMDPEVTESSLRYLINNPTEQVEYRWPCTFTDVTQAKADYDNLMEARKRAIEFEIRSRPANKF